MAVYGESSQSAQTSRTPSNNISSNQFLNPMLSEQGTNTSARPGNYDDDSEDMAPIHKLPNEILTQIFERFHIHIGVKNPEFMHVCSRWRTVAITSPTVWTFVALDLATEGNCHARLLKTHLEYSKVLPLTVILELRDRSSEDCLDLVVSHAARWKSLQLILHGPWSPQGSNLALRFATIRELALLKVFSCISAAENFHSPSDLLPSILGPARNLQKLLLDDFSLFPDVEHSFQRTPITQLVLLVNRSNATFKKLVECCRWLIELKYVISSWESRVPIQVLAPQDSNTVQVLQVELQNEGRGVQEFFIQLLCACTFPALTSLSISPLEKSRHRAMFSGAWPAQEFNDLFSRSGCRLTTLALNYISLSDINVICLLLNTPALTDLTIREVRPSAMVHRAAQQAEIAYYSNYGGVVRNESEPQVLFPVTKFFLRNLRIRHLIYDDDNNKSQSQPLVPKLARLTLDVNGTDGEFDEEAFGNMVFSRCPPMQGSTSAEQVSRGLRCLKFVKLRVFKRGSRTRVVEIDLEKEDGWKGL
ncbi:hypothetical protein VKT23_009649 [Stygiomarasmius scandens]|uniref:F-box domain-containing protein n=1 Tax=Marasmiellus scandens TaxID=2682957 RepID=A0ABR1JHP3_9AGAR